MSIYFQNNELAINIDKTSVMIITEDEEIIKSEMIIENQIIKNKQTMKELSLTIS